MTIVLGMIGADGIILSADGRVVFEDGSSPKNDYKKVYVLDNVIAGFAARGLGGYEDMNYFAGCQLLRQPEPFSVKTFAEAMASMAKNDFAGRREVRDFEIGFIVAGYDRDADGCATEPRMYKIRSLNNYKVEDTLANKEVVSIIGQKTVLDSLPTELDTVSLKRYFLEMIRKNECDTVGGDITTYIINKDGFEKTIQKTN